MSNKNGNSGGPISANIHALNELVSSKFGDNGVIMFHVSFLILLAIFISLIVYVCYQCKCKSRADSKKVGYSKVYMQDSDTSEHSSSNQA